MLGQGHERVRPDQTPIGMLPAHQCLHVRDGAVGAGLRLVMQPQITGGYGMAELGQDSELLFVAGVGR